MKHTEKELLELMIRFEGITRHEMMHRYRKNNSAFDPNRGQGRIMSLLKLQPEISQKELGFLLDMSKQALAELLSKLEAAGYITRMQSEEDKRVMLIKFTESGVEAASGLEQQEQEASSVFECLSQEEQENLYDYLVRLIAEGERRIPEGLRRHQRFAHGRMNQNGGHRHRENRMNQ